jgi:predicted O-methyltransferase YrrM
MRPEGYDARDFARRETHMNEGEWNPRRLLQLSGGYWSTCALHAGVKLDVFTAIGESPATLDELVDRVGAPARGLAMLLDGLAAMDLLKKTGNRYEAAAGVRKHLSKESPDYLGYMILHHHHLMESWARLDQSVKSGRPTAVRASRDDPVRRESFLMGMLNSATQTAPKIVPSLDLEGRRHLVDVGGGPGTYAIHMCQANPGLRATVFDLPTTRPFAEQTIERFGLSDRIDFVEGDFIEQDIPGSYDVAWLSHVLHAEGPDGCKTILDRAVAALEPGGMIMVHEFILRDTMDGPLFPALFAMNMLLRSQSGQSYSESQIADMLIAAGAKNIHRIPLTLPNDSGVMVGVV